MECFRGLQDRGNHVGAYHLADHLCNLFPPQTELCYSQWKHKKLRNQWGVYMDSRHKRIQNRTGKSPPPGNFSQTSVTLSYTDGVIFGRNTKMDVLANGVES